MIQLVLKFVASIVISNWVYSELCLSIPHFRSVSDSVYRTVKIPTHDQWPGIIGSGNSRRLDASLRRSVSSAAPKANIFDSNTASLWAQASARFHNLFSFNIDLRPPVSRSYLSDEDMFGDTKSNSHEFEIGESKSMID